MVFVRLLQVLLTALILGGCTFFFDVQDSVQPDSEPDSRQQRIIFDRIQQITQSMKEVGPSEISNVGPNEGAIRVREMDGLFAWICRQSGALFYVFPEG